MNSSYSEPRRPPRIRRAHDGSGLGYLGITLLATLILLVTASCNLQETVNRGSWAKKKDCAKIGQDYSRRKETEAQNGNTVIDEEYGYNRALDTCLCSYTLVVPGAYHARFVDDALTGRTLASVSTTDAAADRLQFETDRRTLLAGGKPESSLIRKQQRF